MSTFGTLAGLQNAIAREDRLADEPLGPEQPSSKEDFRDFCEARDLSEGDTLVWDDGAESVVEGIVPALASDEEVTQVIVHLYTESDDTHTPLEDYNVGWLLVDGTLEALQ